MTTYLGEKKADWIAKYSSFGFYDYVKWQNCKLKWLTILKRAAYEMFDVVYMLLIKRHCGSF